MGLSLKLEALGLLKPEGCEAFRRTKGTKGRVRRYDIIVVGLPDLRVEYIDRLPDGTRNVHEVTAEPTAAACPSCGVSSKSAKGRVTTSPHDIPYGEKRIILRWNKTR
ncbi:hypothetical protein MSIMFB_01764 [Mycobacterium simulans]|uniref:Transposase IS204/IS1001/IS1096/IS1165 zinc-finger domain-containing protein n=1 Tax=Mycobacterium simulans TaxID=627089 RepID=A0A7Z7ILA3_9MYCO|nr:hypothetical protein MSIMFB_01764 [Mycobacterium simulans]